MKNQKIKTIWKKHSKYLAKESTDSINLAGINQRLSAMFCPGQFYYYIVDFGTNQLTHVSKSYKDIIGLEPSTLTANQLIGRAHPDDIDFISRCLEIVANFLFKFLEPEEILNYKVSYNFRLKIKDGTYRLFMHQITALSLDEDNRLGSVFDVHADISHITTVNQYQLSFFGLNGAPSYTNIKVEEKNSDRFSPNIKRLSPREYEVLRKIADGATAKEIASKLFIAEPTVRKHRENLLRKTKSNNTAHLVSNCIRNGLI